MTTQEHCAVTNTAEQNAEDDEGEGENDEGERVHGLITVVRLAVFVDDNVVDVINPVRAQSQPEVSYI